MKIHLSQISAENFIIKEFELAGEKLYLVFPQHIGCKWDSDNLIFRSSIWNSNGELVSASFKKFFNWGEQPNLIPPPIDIKGCSIVEKIDGSALIVSKYKGRIICRTRGTADASALQKNGNEIEIFKKECAIIFNDFDETWDYSYIFEWTSPSNKIILNYGDVPQFYLIAKIFHTDYRLETQENLDTLAKIFNFKRPKTYSYSSLSEMISDVESWAGKEGCVVYSTHGQVLHKTKSKWYLNLHRLKSEISTVDSLVKIWIAWGKPSYADFYAKITAQFDYELAEQNRGNISKVCDAHKEVEQIIAGMVRFIEKIKELPTRKDQALQIMNSYGATARSGILFSILDGKPIDNEVYNKLMLQVISKGG